MPIYSKRNIHELGASYWYVFILHVFGAHFQHVASNTSRHNPNLPVALWLWRFYTQVLGGQRAYHTARRPVPWTPQSGTNVRGLLAHVATARSLRKMLVSFGFVFVSSVRFSGIWLRMVRCGSPHAQLSPGCSGTSAYMTRRKIDNRAHLGERA